MRLLELFKGTGSVEKAARTLGYSEIVSLDIDPKYGPDICSDIMDWDYRTYPPGYFDVVWASPPCTYYSPLQNMYADRHPDLEARRQESDGIVRRVLEIINYFGPRYWFMENPWSGALKRREVVAGLPYIDGDYCQYGYPYRKRTRFWTNRLTATLRKCQYDCPWSLDLHHVTSVCPRGGLKMKEGERSIREVCQELGISYDLELRYSIPQPLLLELLPPVRRSIKVRSRSQVPDSSH